MLRRLFANTFFSALAFAGSSVIAILLVPLLLHTYGVARFGIITLARVFLPSGVFAALDFGMSEVVTQVIARARAGAPWDRAGRQVTLLATMALVIGATVSLVLLAFSARMPAWLHVEAAAAPAFTAVLRVTALANLVLVPGLVCDGILKGFERFGALRATELGAALVYAVLTVLAVSRQMPYEIVAYAFLVGAVAKALFLGVIALRLVSGSQLRPARWDLADRREVAERCQLMFHGKLLGIAQSQLPPLAVGATVGPAGVGIYDLLLRIPRFTKAVLGLLNTALIPVAARAEEQEDLRAQRRLGMVGLLVIPALVVPPLAAAAAFSEPLLRIWVGDTFAPYWPWHAAIFMAPVATAVVSFGSTALLVRTDATRVLLWLATAQVILQYVIAFGFLKLLGERAFVLGQAVSISLIMFLQQRTIARHQGVPARTSRQLWWILALCVLMTCVTFVTPLTAISHAIPGIFAAAAWCAVAWLAIGFGVFTAEQRHEIFKRLRFARR